MVSTTHDETPERLLMEITCPGNLATVARFRGQTIATDQPVAAGGGGSAPPPFDLFLASIGTCSLFYAVRFCQQREISTEGLVATLEPVRDSDSGRFGLIRIGLRLPEEFPEKYRRAILRAVDQCTVKRHIVEPPQFEVTLLDDRTEEAGPVEPPSSLTPS